MHACIAIVIVYDRIVIVVVVHVNVKLTIVSYVVYLASTSTLHALIGHIHTYIQ
jgi:hypothetical protein